MSGSLDSVGFSGVFGDARGVTDARALRERLRGAERELDEMRARTRSTQTELGALQRGVVALNDLLRASTAALHQAQLQIAEFRRDLDVARYAAMFAGSPDPVISAEDVHHGPWTPGRPYLEGQHVSHPVGWECFRATAGGVRAGRPPGIATEWEHCPVRCLEPERISTEPHPVQTGYALRQSEFWWDASGRQSAIVDLTPEHLSAVIDWLTERVDSLWDSERRRATPLVPCPPTAYASPDDWLADMPLMRALRSDAARRQATPNAICPADL